MAASFAMRRPLAAERATPERLAKRRQALAESLGRGVVALLGHSEEDGQSGFTGFRQESNFYYLTQHREPGAALLIAPVARRRPYLEILFLPRATAASTKWSGPRLSAAEAGDLGFREVMDGAKFSPTLLSLLRERGPLFGLAGSGAGKAPKSVARLKQAAGGESPRPADRHLAELRSVKSPGEVRLIQGAVDATVSAFRAALARVKPGATERSVAAEIVATAFRAGCDRLAFPPIVASGANATVLHYRGNSDILSRGHAVLIDAGAECSHYAADMARTAPVSGRFDGRQRMLYGVVRDAQRAVIEAARPGVPVSTGARSLEAIAQKVLRKGVPDGVDAWLPHAIGHHVGLDVHDLAPPRGTLKEGMVLAIEPGLYLPEESLGIRIEDIVEIRRDGCRVLSAALPRGAREIEALVGTG